MAEKENLFAVVPGIFLRSVKVYVQNFGKFLIYLSFPVLGAIIGIILIYAMTFLFADWIVPLGEKNPVFASAPVMIFTVLIFLAPGFYIFFKAFYDYIIAVMVLNFAADELGAQNKIGDLKSYNSAMMLCKKEYFALILLLSLFYIVFCFPLFWLFLIVFIIYSSLSLQALALDKTLSGANAIEKSFKTISGNAASTILLLLLLYFLTYEILPAVVNGILKITGITNNFLSIPAKILFNRIHIEEMLQNLIKTVEPVSDQLGLVLPSFSLVKEITEKLISFCVMGFTLPIRAIACTLWYKNLSSKKTHEENIKRIEPI